MRRRNRPLRWGLNVLLSSAAFALSACGSGQATATPTIGVEAIYTAAFNTLAAQRATELALTPPTPAVTATLFPTLPSVSTLPVLPFTTSATSSAGGGVAGCNNSAFVNDVTIPDGTVLEPGKNFVKTWTVMNNGSCAWDASYKLTFVSGNSMGGTSVPVPLNVPAGQQTRISVSLITPSTPGDYTGSWQLQNPQGQTFGNIITVVIKVSAAATATSTTAAPAPTGTPSPTGTPTPIATK
ncbi:MAG TPA: NBR1-Ig-like domain-containing protein [Anaerolineales bacterium]